MISVSRATVVVILPGSALRSLPISMKFREEPPGSPPFRP